MIKAMMHDGVRYGFGFGGPFMWLFWILLIVGVLWVIKAFAGGRPAVLNTEGCGASCYAQETTINVRPA